MAYLQYGQLDHPHRHYGRGDEDYPPPPINLPPYTPPLEDPVYGGGRAYHPPPSYDGTYDAPPPRGYHSSSYSPYMESQNYAPPTSYVGHEYETNPHFKNHDIPSLVEWQFNQKPKYEINPNNKNNYVIDGVRPIEPELGFLANKPSYKICCKAGGERYAVAVRDGKVVLTYSNSNDPTQHWFKDERCSTKVKDEERRPSFILVNKATRQAVKHSVAGFPVQLIPYKPDVFDESIMWTESKELGSGFRTIRTVNNISLVMDAFHGDKNHGGVHDGTIVALYKCWKGDNQNQQWKLIPY